MAKAKTRNISVNGLTRPDWRIIQPGMKPVKVNGISREYDRLLWDALYYVHYEISEKQRAASFVKWAAENIGKSEAADLKKIKDYWFSVLGKYTYCWSKGTGLTAELEQSILSYYTEKLKPAIAEAIKAEQIAKQKADKDSLKPVVSIQDRMREQVRDFIGKWDGEIDLLVAGTMRIEKFDPHTDIKISNTIKPAHAKMIRAIYEKDHAEALALVAGKNDELQESFSHLHTVRQRKAYLAIFDKILNACDAVISEGKAQRKPKMRKAPSKDKLVAKLKYQPSEPSLGISSINPLNILQSNELWVYNTKNRKLMYFVADEMLGPLTVKGTSIDGYDPVRSTQKTVRKPEETIKGSDKLSKTKFRKLFDSLTTTDTAVNGRVNEYCVVIKAF
jgi:hypothetical protein